MPESEVSEVIGRLFDLASVACEPRAEVSLLGIGCVLAGGLASVICYSECKYNRSLVGITHMDQFQWLSSFSNS